MKVSGIQISDICRQLRIMEEDICLEEEKHLDMLKKAAVSYVTGYTGLIEEELDEHEDITIAVLTLISDMYDNRQMYADKNSLNRVVESILDMHRRNLIPGERRVQKGN